MIQDAGKVSAQFLGGMETLSMSNAYDSFCAVLEFDMLHAAPLGYYPEEKQHDHLLLKPNNGSCLNLA